MFATVESPPQMTTMRLGNETVPCLADGCGFNRHTFLCGQSGSGKTCSLGVILEQLLTDTDLRLVILDPNSDFVHLGELGDGVDRPFRGEPPGPAPPQSGGRPLHRAGGR